MKISKLEWKAYISCQESGVTNMMDLPVVMSITALHKDQILFIMENYDKLMEEYEK